MIELAGPPLGAGMGGDAVEFLRDQRLKFTRDGLKRGAHKFGWLWGWCDRWQAAWSPPRLCNTDGDPILLHTASFALADPLETRRALLDRNDLEYDQQQDEFTWSRDAGQTGPVLGGTVSLGRIQLIGDELVATRDIEGSYAMVYAPVGRSFRVRMDAISGPKVAAWWYNPRNGQATTIGTFDNQGEREFTPPDKGEMIDWVLVLDDAARKYPAPGTRN